MQPFAAHSIEVIQRAVRIGRLHRDEAWADVDSQLNTTFANRTRG